MTGQLKRSLMALGAIVVAAAVSGPCCMPSESPRPGDSNEPKRALEEQVNDDAPVLEVDPFGDDPVPDSVDETLRPYWQQLRDGNVNDGDKLFAIFEQLEEHADRDIFLRDVRGYVSALDMAHPIMGFEIGRKRPPAPPSYGFDNFLVRAYNALHEQKDPAQKILHDCISSRLLNVSMGEEFPSSENETGPPGMNTSVGMWWYRLVEGVEGRNQMSPYMENADSIIIHIGREHIRHLERRAENPDAELADREEIHRGLYKEFEYVHELATREGDSKTAEKMKEALKRIEEQLREAGTGRERAAYIHSLQERIHRVRKLISPYESK